MSDRYLIVGLGNPGRKYKKSRHNIGFQVVDHFARQHGLKFKRQRSKAFVTTGNISGYPVVLVKPQNFMNACGVPVATLQRFYKIELDHLLVVYDDLDIPIGTLRMKASGGSGGHRGMNSIIQRLGSKDFPRLRVGIGRPPGRMEPAAYVLQKFGKDQLPVVQETYDRAANAIETWLKDGIEVAMTRHNGPPPE